MNTPNQGTDEWKSERVGKVTASRLADLMARTKTGWSKSRDAYMSQLAIERITKQPYTFPTSSSMDWGTKTEPEARNEYRSICFDEVSETGFVPHPSINDAGASPDGLVGDHGLIEIKCPETHTHLGYILNDDVPEKYFTQMQWQMACTGRKWCDFVSYDPRSPEGLKLFIKRVDRDDCFIATSEEMVRKFLSEVEQMVEKLMNKLAEKQNA
jgi:putative phage-type endonuclease